MSIFSTKVNPQPSSFSLENLTQKAWEKASVLPKSNIAVITVGMVALTILSALNVANESAKIALKIVPSLFKFGFDNTPLLKRLQIGSYFPESVDIKHVYQHAYRLANFALEILLLPTYGIVKTDDVIKRHKATFKPYSVQVPLIERFQQAKQKVIEKAKECEKHHPWLVRGAAGVGALAVIAYIGWSYVGSGKTEKEPINEQERLEIERLEGRDKVKAEAIAKRNAALAAKNKGWFYKKLQSLWQLAGMK